MTTTSSPFRVGDRVRGTSYVPPDLRRREAPEPFEGIVVQVGTGYPKIDAEGDFLWVRLADCTERQSLVTDTELHS
ncbi:hypothetical protein [Streptomyces graminilatus]|uniref:hypothetical protein n=1 Tax=Streptomyces graminilatus TaxID=1464070 RepID=UPI000ABA0BCA|nr:hypothetical protein [Streptomyces graminilatus]